MGEALHWIAIAGLRTSSGHELDPGAVEAMAAVLGRAAPATG